MPQPMVLIQPLFQFYTWRHKMTASEWAAIAVAVGTLIGFLGVSVKFLVKSYLSELKPNGGSSVKDKVNEITFQVQRLEARIDEIYRLLCEKK
jgi:hypothetical protein